MKIKRHDKSQKRELAILGAMVNDSQLLHSVVIWQVQNDDDLFLADAPKKIAKWCIDHYRKFGEAPGTEVLRVSYLEPWEEKIGGGDLCNKVEALRLHVAETWEGSKFTKDQLFNIAEAVLRRQQVLIASDRMGGSSSAETITDILPTAVPVTLTREPEYNSLFENPNVAKDIATIASPVFHFQDEVLDRFFDDSFAASTFTAFIAPEKRGKSQLLLECAINAMKCKKKVLYFDAGDMTEDQIFLRFAARIMNKPYKPGPWFVWESLTEENGNVVFEVEEVESEHTLTQKEANKAKETLAKATRGRFFSRSFPRGMLTVDTMRMVLDSLSMRGIQIDVLIVDYADILGTTSSKFQDNRFKVTEIWGDLRTLSQSYNLALITATQANASSYTEELSEKSYSESKTKRAFITTEIGIDRTEIHESIFKLHYTFRRTGSKSRGIYIASDLATYQPVKHAIWVPRKLEDDKPRQKFRD